MTKGFFPQRWPTRMSAEGGTAAVHFSSRDHVFPREANTTTWQCPFPTSPQNISQVSTVAYDELCLRKQVKHRLYTLTTALYTFPPYRTICERTGTPSGVRARSLLLQGAKSPVRVHLGTIRSHTRKLVLIYTRIVLHLARSAGFEWLRFVPAMLILFWTTGSGRARSRPIRSVHDSVLPGPQP